MYAYVSLSVSVMLPPIKIRTCHRYVSIHLMCVSLITYRKATPVSKHTQLVSKLHLMLTEATEQPSQYILNMARLVYKCVCVCVCVCVCACACVCVCVCVCVHVHMHVYLHYMYM